MSLHKFLVISNLSAASRKISTLGRSRFRPHQLVRWQQTGASGGSRSSVGKLVLYSVAGVSAVAAGTIAYASYDPEFKSTVNEYIPGFKSVADTLIGQWESTNQAPKTTTTRIELVYKTEHKDSPVQSKDKPEKTKGDVTTEQPKATIPPPKKEKPISKEIDSTKSSAPPEPSDVPKPVKETSPHPSPVPEQALSIEKQSENTSIDTVDTLTETPTEETPSTSPETTVPEEQSHKESLYPVESALASVREETEKAAEKILSEQVEDHKSSQSVGEQWMEDTSKVDTDLQQSFDEFKASLSEVATAQGAVIEALKSHQQKVQEVIQSTGDGTNLMETLADNVVSSEKTVADRKQELDEATLKLQEKIAALSLVMNSAEEVGLKSKAESIDGEVSKLMADLDVGETRIREAESSNEVLREYQEEAKRSREQLQSELGTVPLEGDVKQEAIILMQSKRIDVLKKKLEDVEKEKAISLTTALERQKERLEELAEEKLKLGLQKERLEMEQEYAKKESEFAREFESEFREKLRIQRETHSDHLKEALSSQADELGSLWSRELELKLMEQEAQYQAEMSKAMARLRGIESMVNTVANAGELTRNQHTIRNACDTLNGALDQANSNPYDRFTFSKELASLRKAAQEDQFLLSLIETIPKQASSDSAVGIQSEAGLQERFHKVYRVCKRVALVPEIGGGLATYALSYLQSLLVLNIHRPKESSDLSTLDTFELLSLANTSMQCGDLEKAVWYVSHLRNESQRVAQDWLEDARLFLETRQAIRLIQTYISASNIAFLRD